MEPIPPKFSNMIERGYWNNKKQLIIDEHFVIIYSDPVIRYDNDGNQYVIIRDPKAIKRILPQKQNNNKSNYSDSPKQIPSIQRFMSTKETMLKKEFDEIQQGLENMNQQKKAINDKLRKFELKKKYINQQNELLSTMDDAESSNNNPSDTHNDGILNNTVKNHKGRKGKRVKFQVDLSSSKQLQSRKYASSVVGANNVNQPSFRPISLDHVRY